MLILRYARERSTIYNLVQWVLTKIKSFVLRIQFCSNVDLHLGIEKHNILNHNDRNSNQNYWHNFTRCKTDATKTKGETKTKFGILKQIKK